MRILVLGNSSSGGLGLPGPELAWPRLAATQLSAATDEEVPLEHLVFMPIGSRATDFAISKVDAFNPDVVIAVVGSYPCAIGTVGERVRRRFGKRAHRVYQRIERRFENRTGNRGGVAGRANRAGRWLARHVIGSATLASVEDVVAGYSDLLRRLAQREGTHVLVFPEPNWPASVVAENRRADEIFERVRREVRAVAEQHRHLWADSQPAYEAAPNRDALYQTDMAHKSEEGHRVQASVIVEALIRPGGPFAERVTTMPVSGR